MYVDRPTVSSFPGSRKLETRAIGKRGRARAGSLLRVVFYLFAALCDVCAILAAALGSGLAYHWVFYDPRGMAETFLTLGAALAFFFVAPGLVRDEYAIAKFSTAKGSVDALLTHWNVAFISAILIAFFSKMSSEISRGTMALFYIVGIVLVAFVRLSVHRLALNFFSHAGPATRRLFLVGSEAELTRFSERHTKIAPGIRLVGASVVRSKTTAGDDLALAAATARILCPDDVLILMPWSETSAIEECIDAFLRVPASLHLGPEPIIERFSEVSIDHKGGLPSLKLVGAPLRALDIGLKRMLDIAGSSLALVLLAPALAVIALAIKIDSPGPVLFLQRRYGFNQEPFLIYKFRSMTVAEEGRFVQQARAGDARITRVGAFLRRWNLDELPQLFNVLRGDMSLVGPRPHALIHDQQYDRTVSLYARRHNVKPGMTGWAQVNGRRGEISNPDDIRERVELDLFYIDHWSLTFDLKILAMTIFSPTAYRNAG